MQSLLIPEQRASVFCLLFLTATLLQPPPPSVAMVTETKGMVTVSTQQSREVPLKAEDLLRAQTKVTVGKNAELRLVFFDDEHQERVKSNRQVVITSKGCEPQDAVERIGPVNISSRNLSKVGNQMHGDRGAVGVLRGETPKDSLATTPMFGTTILTPRPMFAWPVIANARRYRVEMYTATGTNLADLGRKYVWRVKAPVADGSSETIVDSKFFTATQSEIDELAIVSQLNTADTTNLSRKV